MRATDITHRHNWIHKVTRNGTECSVQLKSDCATVQTRVLRPLRRKCSKGAVFTGVKVILVGPLSPLVSS